MTISANSDAQHERGEHADQDDLLALLGGKARGERADDDRIVARQHEIDHQHLEEGREGRRLGDVGEIVDDRRPHVGGRAEAPGGGHGGKKQVDHQVKSPLSS